MGRTDKGIDTGISASSGTIPRFCCARFIWLMSALLSCNNFTVYLAPIQIGPWANAAIRLGATKIGGRAQKGMSAFPPKADMCSA
ncbi:MAG: hypothetical protein WCA54_20805, partial [Pseudolabrys sp.]